MHCHCGFHDKCQAVLYIKRIKLLSERFGHFTAVFNVADFISISIHQDTMYIHIFIDNGLPNTFSSKEEQVRISGVTLAMVFTIEYSLAFLPSLLAFLQAFFFRTCPFLRRIFFKSILSSVIIIISSFLLNYLLILIKYSISQGLSTFFVD